MGAFSLEKPMEKLRVAEVVVSSGVLERTCFEEGYFG